jgi:hypothetical protein
MDLGRSNLGTGKAQEEAETKMGNDFPEKYGGHCGGFLVSSVESFDPSCINEN